MSDEIKYKPGDVNKHLFRLANTTGEEYQQARKEWDERSIDYAWALLEAYSVAISETSKDKNTMKPELDKMTVQERSLLLYLETCAVDLSGRVDARRMNEHDFEVVAVWMKIKFIDFGRIIVADHNRQGGHWVELSEHAWNLAHKERRSRHARNEPFYIKTKDKNTA